MRMSRREVLVACSSLLVASFLPIAGLAASPTDSMSERERETLSIHSDQGPHKLQVEIARTLPERGRGLMERDSLAPDAGMLFLYDRPQPARTGFWMYRTRIPLDIAFIGEDGRILSMASMTPCTSQDPSGCPVTRAGGTYVAALEVNAGYFAERGIEVGDCVTAQGLEGQCVPSRGASGEEFPQASGVVENAE
ncbi:hypothetical protein GCM10007160_35540 [Litchfieldella qijiaojingensis]|uniref:DUF192 domain-containing protein n=1 Tax=Litchfieldella qijiaojingensis TaxID=980347 RepID=A0ABQ2Z8R5_9GAMM|nr:DUF192 domain-containing protein [Halomonas qijiaojingensis]GGY04771.1 hypothetical protein GCM10007160_35540 [Halomonas qijiaojingensis]